MKYQPTAAARPRTSDRSAIAPRSSKAAPSKAAPSKAAPLKAASSKALSSKAGRAKSIARIAEVAPLVRRVFEVRPTGEERERWMSLTAHQLDALAALCGESVTMGELCQRLDISESAGTALSDRLVAHGMVVREADPSDRRVVRLALSEEARAAVTQFAERKRNRIEEVLSVLDDRELEMLADIYERLVATERAFVPDCRNVEVAARSAERRRRHVRGGKGQ